ncbi:hypothetical protein QBC36DRAFT_195297, partial [Triangularia setosa]
MSVLLTGIKDSYPTDYNRWCREFDQDSLHWEHFIKELTRIGNLERGDLRLPLVETRKAKSNDHAQSTSPSGNNSVERLRKERIICTTCNKQSWSNLIHHDKCGKHIPKDGQCYCINNEVQQALKAPNTIITKDSIVLDTGAMYSTFNHLKWFTELHPMPEPLSKSLKAANLSWDFDSNTIIHKPSAIAIRCLEYDELPIIPADTPRDFKTTTETIEYALLASINYQVMHRRLMHASRDVVVRACKDAEIDLRGHQTNPFCEPCALGKATDQMPKVTSPMANEALDFIRIDVISH